MKRQYQPVETPLGFVRGRDGIYLDEVIIRDGTSTLILAGSFNTRLCSAAPTDVVDFSGYRITFTGVLAVEIIELDSWDWQSDSCIDEILDSDWIKSLGGKVTSQHRHYLVQTYDDVIEVVCEQITIEMIPVSSDDAYEAPLRNLKGCQKVAGALRRT